MKGHRRRFAHGVILSIVLLILTIPVFAAGSKQTWNDVLVGGITIELDGETIQPTDENGNSVDPVIYDGTTYLPVRAVASALGLEVKWDGSTRTVILNSDMGEKTEPIPEQPANEETSEQKEAVAKAKCYLEIMAFSRNGLIERLESNEFSHLEAEYGVDNCGADWLEQAAKKAAFYLEITSFSRNGMIELLEADGFTHEQALFGADAVGCAEDVPIAELVTGYWFFGGYDVCFHFLEDGTFVKYGFCSPDSREQEYSYMECGTYRVSETKRTVSIKTTLSYNYILYNTKVPQEIDTNDELNFDNAYNKDGTPCRIDSYQYMDIIEAYYGDQSQIPSDQESGADKWLSKDDLEIRLIVPTVGDKNWYAYIEVTNNSASTITLSEACGINGYVVWTKNRKPVDVAGGSKVKISYYNTSYAMTDQIVRNMYFDNNSTGYNVIEWNGDQYYAEFGVDGITTFYRGNVNGPA